MPLRTRLLGFVPLNLRITVMAIYITVKRRLNR